LRPVKLRIPYFSGGVLETSSSGSIMLSGSTSSLGRIIYDGNPAKITVEGGKLDKK
jgi:hypothetical protein